MSEKLQMRVYGDAALPTLIYLPGMHGDWTLVGSFRRALAGRVRFVEFTYPRTLTWSLDDYAEGVETALAEQGIARGWLLGESFSSQVVWSLVARKQFEIQAVVLAGGFVRHPMRWGVRLAERLCGGISLGLITRILFGYAKVARFRYRHSPEVQANINEFIARRTELDRQAAKHRLHLIAQYDPRPIAREVTVPVFALNGFVDPIVPWCFVRPWLNKNCPALREYRIMWRADHNVLGTAADASAEQIVQWMNETACRVQLASNPTGSASPAEL
jgi:pimeloyl-ACP methyl ester carboxylesterase